MRYDPFDTAAWIMIQFGIYMAILQTLIMGNPPTVTRDQLGRLGRG